MKAERLSPKGQPFLLLVILCQYPSFSLFLLSCVGRLSSPLYLCARMFLDNPQTLQKLGFDTILAETRRLALSEEAREIIDAIVPTDDAAVLLPALETVREFSDLLRYDEPFPADHFASVGLYLRKAAVEGAWLNTQELHSLLRWLQTVRKVRAYLHNRKERFPRLDALVNTGGYPQGLVGAIERVVDEYGNLRSDASPELSKIRRDLQSASAEVRNVLIRVLRKANESGWGAADEITIRNDRFVVPVRADSKGRVPGFVQDVSQSGNTVFIEPAETLPLNNRVRELQIAEHNEIVRILQAITDRIREDLDTLSGFREAICEVDVIRAKALLAVRLDAVLPKVVPGGKVLKIISGRFPLLALRASQPGEKPFPVVPLEVTFHEKRRIAVISGPNAGGKSVSLKTVGLLQVMLQAGFLIPCDERSEFRLFGSVYVDIGDSQSVESDLSTYTSHLAIMRRMGDGMNADSLFLIDEFGGGTDPQLGGPIAEAFLERFVFQKAYGIITTHYGILKDYAEVTSGVFNAAMQFDTNALRPTFVLMEGVPGRSYAFEIAERVGVHGSILKKARTKLGSEGLNTEKLVRELERKVVDLERKAEEARRKELEMNALKARYETLEKEITTHKRKLMDEAKREAQTLVQQANRDIERTIREIREAQADKERTRLLRENLRTEWVKPVEEEEENPLPEPSSDTERSRSAESAAKPSTKKSSKKDKPEPPAVLEGTPAEGDFVKFKTSDSQGVLVELNGSRAVVQVGDIRMNVKLNQLVRTAAPKRATEKASTVFDLKKKSEAKMELDLMGKRVEEALPVLEAFLDNALFAGLPSVHILHGKGTGALKDAVRDQLRNMKQVVRFGDAPHEMGGAGWTIAELKA